MPGQSPNANIEQRAYMGGHFAVEVDGTLGGWLFSAEGGNPAAEVISEKVGPDHIAHKHIGGIKYDDLTVTCGAGMNRSFYQWIEKSFGMNAERKHGAIVAADYNFKERSRLTFHNGLITEVTMPALDAGAKDPARLTVKITPEYTRQTMTRSGPTLGGSGIYEKVKHWLPSNFRLWIRGLELPCSRVSKIDAISFKQKIVESPINESRDFDREPAAVEVSNLVITVPESHAEPLYQWFEDFAIRGNNSNDDEKDGHLEYLSPNTRDEYFRISMGNIGIFKLTADKLEAGGETIRRVKAELYVETMKFEYEGGKAFGS